MRGVEDHVLYLPGVTKHEDDDHRGHLEVGGHRDLSWGEVDNLLGVADRRGHLLAACSKDHDKDRDMDHADEGEEGGNTETYDPMDASCRSPCEVLTSVKDCGSHLVLGISLDFGLSHGHLDCDDDSFLAPCHGLCQI